MICFHYCHLTDYVRILFQLQRFIFLLQMIELVKKSTEYQSQITIIDY